MRPVCAEAGSVDVGVADLQVVPAECLALDVAVHAGMADKQADAVVVVAVRLPAEQVGAGLEAEQIAVEGRRHGAAPFHLDILPEYAAPNRGKPACIVEQRLFAAPLVEGAQCRVARWWATGGTTE